MKINTVLIQGAMDIEVEYLKEELSSHINMLENYRDNGYEKFINKFGITIDEEFGTIYEIDETGGRIGRMWNI